MAKTTVAPDGTVTVTTDTAYEAVSWDQQTAKQELVKSVDEKRYTLSVGYPADLADVAVARDGHRDFASRDEIEKAAWGYLANGGGVGLHHADGTEGHGRVVESYIYRGPDWTENTQVIKSGDWLVGIVWDTDTWDAIKKGSIRGTSMQGTAKRRAPNPADVARVVNRRG